CQNIFFPSLTAFANKTSYELTAKFLPPGGLGRPAAKESSFQYTLNHVLQDLAGGGDFSVMIVSSSKQLRRNPIDHHVAGSGIESNDIVRPGIRGNRRKISDPTDILCNSSSFLIPINDVIEIRNKRRTFPSCRHISWTKIRYHRNAHARGDNRRFSRLPGCSRLSSQES